MAGTNVCNYTNIKVSIPEGGSSCLVCPIRKVERGIVWKNGNNQMIYRDDIPRSEEHSYDVNDDKCHGDNYSLSILNVSAYHNYGCFTCLKLNRTVASFCLVVEGM